MRLGFDVTPLLVPKSGIGTYAKNLLDHLIQASTGGRSGASELDIIPLANRPVGEDQDGSRRLNKTLWMQSVLPWQAGRLRLDVCHFTNNVAPLWTPCPSVVTIHDMTLWLYPEHHYAKRLLAMRPIIPLAVRRAAAIIAVSESAKHDIVRLLGVPAEKVHVVYEAAAPCFRPLPAGPAQVTLRQKYGLAERFVLTVGTLEPRKNLVRLLEAFAQLRKRDGLSHTLVFVGGRGWKDGPVFEAVERLDLGHLVRFLGHVPTADLVGLYNLAEALAFPSLYEGFGLPAIEAMACGTPVITSRRGSLVEVAGSAAQFIDPLRVESIAEGLHRVLSDAALREDLRVKGLAQASRFSWTRAAAETCGVYRLATHLLPVAGAMVNSEQ